MQSEKDLKAYIVHELNEYQTRLAELHKKIANSPVTDKEDQELLNYLLKNIAMCKVSLARRHWQKRPSLLNRIFRKK